MLTKASIESKLREYFKDQPIVRAFLFGSFSKNQQTSTSDVDLLVELDKKAKVGLIKFISIKLDLEDIFQTKVDLLADSGISPLIKSQIDKEKILVYER